MSGGCPPRTTAFGTTTAVTDPMVNLFSHAAGRRLLAGAVNGSFGCGQFLNLAEFRLCRHPHECAIESSVASRKQSALLTDDSEASDQCTDGDCESPFSICDR